MIAALAIAGLVVGLVWSLADLKERMKGPRY